MKKSNAKTIEEYKEYKKRKQEEKKKQQHFKKVEKHEKDKIRFKTIRYLERNCKIEKKCQICGTTEKVEIHHPNYKDYLKINLLCKKHHTDLHNFELVPPSVIDLQEISEKK